MGWTPEQAPEQDGRIFVITGGNSGIGYEAARILARVNAEVVLACRSEEKANAALASLRAEFSEVKASFLQLDLADLASIRKAADRLRERYGAVDVLINNAGVMALPRRETADGFEMQLGTNHFGHFALTGLIIDLIQDRVVNVSSGLHLRGKMNFDDLMGEQSYDKWKAYSQSKLANMLFTFELHRRLEASGSDVRAIACHPGYAATNLQTAGADMTGSKFQRLVMKAGNALLAQTAERGAWPTVFAAIGDVPSGSYTGPQGLLEMRGAAHISKKISRAAEDPEAAAKLWEISETLTGVSFLD